MAKVHTIRAWGAHLAQLRRNAGMSGGDVVERLHSFGIQVDRRSIYAYEAGRIAAPDAGLVWGLGKVYGVAVEELISALVIARTGQKSAPLPVHQLDRETIQVTGDERELLQQIRNLPPKSLEICREFIAFQLQRKKVKGPRSQRKQE
jgi:transcriptional regulator with XRE-family HTH domain